MTNKKISPTIKRDLSVGEVAARAGVAVSTLHFYEAEGLITGHRTSANHRRYERNVLRRIAIVRVAQRAGIPLKEIRSALSALPGGRTPNREDWEKLSAAWRGELNERIERLTRLRDQLTGCIGCGCLSTQECPLRNPYDILGEQSSGPVLLEPRGDFDETVR
ncbi:redox-sensitive transcriptional activator SoxR [Mesorhizobium australicum]|uniref:MerR family transcriptional regulator, redox-sensitive transcriptional activator SoxR n=1 Tax=Mesorhizobium australicum TaxID=536018 RepID=A0A1X7NUQ7_9HYPH|nr:redox-sensitive transcriptional activator SoxR [Mesorhizobium australicum]SMH41890.1 MerR family transcriptional regulator, redox-sensitive transcriptional activator SoxR [Mesorhizobium australicum]